MWGWYLTLFRTPWFCMKILRVQENSAISFQKHTGRSELWFVKPFKDLMWCRYIPKNTWHYLGAFGGPSYVLEFQWGKLVKEDDIERDWKATRRLKERRTTWSTTIAPMNSKYYMKYVIAGVK